MAGRFTKRAVRVVHAAVAEAERRGDPKIGTEHLLLGVAADPPDGLGVTVTVLREALDAMDADSLTAVGVDVDPALVALAHDEPAPGAAEAVGTPIPVGAPTRWFRGAHRPLTAGARATLGGAPTEAKLLRHRHIGPEHILLGLTAGPVGDPAVTLLARVDLEPATLRAVILDRLRATA